MLVASRVIKDPYASWDWNIDPYICHRFMVNVGEYSSPMEHLGLFFLFNG